MTMTSTIGRSRFARTLIDLLRRLSGRGRRDPNGNVELAAGWYLFDPVDWQDKANAGSKEKDWLDGKGAAKGEGDAVPWAGFIPVTAAKVAPINNGASSTKRS